MAYRLDNDTNITKSISSGEHWYYISFADDGKANFYINPDDTLDVDLYVYASDMNTLLGSSSKGTGVDDLVSNIAVKRGETYYAKVAYYSGSGAYLIRCKNYPEAGSSIIDNFRNDTSLGLSQSKKDSMVSVLSTLLSNDYEPAFIAGVLGNIQAEGTCGNFESSAYISHPEAEPAYLKYMDSHYNYRQEYSGKNISEVGVEKTYSLLQQIKADGVANTATFGLGCVQWTWDRTRSLIDCYVNVCGLYSYPTQEQCRQAENAMIIKELDGAYHYVYTNWVSQYKDTDRSAYNAGSIICKQYEVPADTNNKAIIRGNNAEAIYKVMMG